MQLAKISSAGTEYLDPYEVTGEWNFRHNSEKTNEFWRGLRVRYWLIIIHVDSNN